MKSMSTRLAGLLAVLWLAALFAGSAGAVEIYGEEGNKLGLYIGNSLLEAWDVAAAETVAERMLESAPRAVAARAMMGRVRFFQGRYEEAAELLAGITGEFTELVETTATVMAGAESLKSEHFEIFWVNPKDEVMARAGLEGLEAARASVERTLGWSEAGRVRVEIYPSVADFTSVSTLTRKEVKTSGTIGLCKFNRLMITSPRATLYGYPWRDTLAHEYIHYAIYKITGGRAPIWVHEGLARYLESGWRGEVGELGPATYSLLVRRLRANDLITLDEMSPSVAKLESAEDTALAFAEVSTMMEHLVDRRGMESLVRLTEELGSGTGDREALESAWGADFDDFYASWLEWADNLPETREAMIVGLKLADEGGDPEELGDTKGGDPEALDYARLGELLRRRGRMKAAAAEFAKAYALAPELPTIAAKHSLGRIAVGEYERALEAVDGIIDLYPRMGLLLQRRGEALMGLERFEEAASTYGRMMDVNPFDVRARRSLLMAARASSDAAEATRQEEFLKILGDVVSPH